jgi:hypothetical protein
MKKLVATTLIAFALVTPAMAFDISSIDGIPSDMKEMITKQSGGRVTNNESQQTGQQGQQQGSRQSRKKLSAQDKACSKPISS